MKIVQMSIKSFVCLTERLLKLGQMEELGHFLQTTLAKDFGYEDNMVIDSLQVSMEELRKAKMDNSPKPTDGSELPTKPFGLFVPPSVEQILGRRTIESEKDLLSGKRKSIKELQHPSIPADGGPTTLPAGEEIVVNGPAGRRARSSVSPGKSDSSGGGYDTMNTSGTADSRASYAEYQSSRTSYRATSEESSVNERPLSTTGQSTKSLPSEHISAPSKKALNSSQLSIAEANEILEKQEKEDNERHQIKTNIGNQGTRTSPSQNSTSDYDNMENNMEGSMYYEKNLDKTLESVEMNNTRNRKSEYGEHVSVIEVSGYQEPGRYRSPSRHSNTSKDYPSPSRVSVHSYQSMEYPSPSGRQSRTSHRSGGVPEMYRSDDTRFILMTAPSPSPTTNQIQQLQMNGSIDHMDGRYPLSGPRSPTRINGYHQQHQQYHKAYGRVPRSQTSPLIDGSQPLVLTTAPIDAKPAYKSSVYL